MFAQGKHTVCLCVSSNKLSPVLLSSSIWEACVNLPQHQVAKKTALADISSYGTCWHVDLLACVANEPCFPHMMCGAAMLDVFLWSFHIQQQWEFDWLSHNKDPMPLRVPRKSYKRQSLAITYALSSSFMWFLFTTNPCFFNHVQHLILLLLLNKH